MKIKARLDRLPGFVNDILFVIIVIGAVCILSQLTLGLWTPLVVVESGSMVPNLNIGDIIVVQGASRTAVIPWQLAEKTNHKSFNLPGDVILYRPYGKDKPNLIDQVKAIIGLPLPTYKATPVIHRALYYVNKGDPMWKGGPVAPFSGFITKGDHNQVIDQQAGQILGPANLTYLKENRDLIRDVSDSIYLDDRTGFVIYELNNKSYVGEGISYLVPVKDDWIIGVARIRIPIIGYIRLLPNIISDQVNKMFKGYAGLVILSINASQ